MRLCVSALAAVLLACGPAGYVLGAGAITVGQPWARPAAAGNSAAYFTLQNDGAADRLVAVSSIVARAAEMHSSSVDAQGVGRMVPVQAVDLPEGAQATFAPGGLHVMLIGLKEPLVMGQHFPLTLTFEKAGPLTIEVAVEKAAPRSGIGADHPSHGTTSP